MPKSSVKPMFAEPLLIPISSAISQRVKQWSSMIDVRTLSMTSAFWLLDSLLFTIWQQQTARQQKIAHAHESPFYHYAQFPHPFAITYCMKKYSPILFGQTTYVVNDTSFHRHLVV
jgi:hypothetical protein